MSAINESTVKLNDQKYVLTTIKDNKGFGLHFIPDSKTLDIPKNTQVDTITAALKKAMPALGDSIWYSINNDASGLVFYINGYDYTDTIAKELNKLGAIKTEGELEEAVDTGAYRRLVITSPKHKLIQTGAEKYLTQNAHMYPELTFKVMTSPKPNTFVIDLVGNKATVVGIKLQDLAEKLDKMAIVVVRKEKKLGVKESVITEITEDVATAFLILAQAAIINGMLIVGQMTANNSGGDGFHPIDDLKAWWQKRKSDKALRSIVNKIKGDEDVVKFMKLTPSQQRGKFRSLIATKLNNEELEYLSKINKSHFQTESVITEAEAPLYKDWNEFTNPDYIIVHLKDGRKLQINKRNVAGGQRVYQAILQAFTDERTDITNKVVAAMASMLGGTLKN
jgi:hypothetical protein